MGLSDNKSKKVTYLKPNSRKVKSVSIPASIKINGIFYQVTEIPANAFKNCKKLKSVTIGSNVTTIKAKAFYGCKKLKKMIKKAGAPKNAKVTK